MLRGIHQITIAVFIVGVTIVTISWLNTKDETARIFRPIGLNDFESKLAYEYLTKGVRPDQQMNANKKPREADRAGWPRYHGYGDTRSCKNDWTHKGLIDLFDLWVKMADLLDVNYTLTHGTMIGALRDGDLVPYDQDVDVMMNIDEVPKFAQMIDEHFSDKDEKVHLTIHKEYRKPVKERGMWSCNGDRIYKTQWYRDQCSTQEPLGRLLRGPVLHIDLFSRLPYN
ncbi:uncharacterized protein [Clytia hemisphaerica]|uniref:LicD/FKTN/FKRP nucleotidyltransferase domain-containing protein n=1 Tax=Clytia hemisphaerica TaxID=252671 RepID=A0A7M5XDJ5_9CNID